MDMIGNDSDTLIPWYLLNTHLLNKSVYAKDLGST
jgi:hypothetical protein